MMDVTVLVMAIASSCLMLSTRSASVLPRKRKPKSYRLRIHSRFGFENSMPRGVGQDKSQCVVIADRTERGLCQAASSSMRK